MDLKTQKTLQEQARNIAKEPEAPVNPEWDMRTNAASPDYTDGDMIEYDMRGILWKLNTLTNCKMVKADLRSSDLFYVTFKNCDLTDADMRDARYFACTFIDCDLTGVKGLGEGFRNNAIIENCKGV